MLPLHLVSEIKRLLVEGKLSQRKIAKKLEVARGTVQAIASGRRGLHGRETASLGDDTNLDAPPERCPTCGVLVTMPCVYCRAISYAQRKKRHQAAEIQSLPQRRAA